MAEHYILSNIPLNKRVYILRPSMIHGPGNKGNLNLLYNVVKKGIPWPLGAFDNKRSFCSVENLCFIINELINRSDIPSGIFNVCDDTPISTNTLISLMSDLNNRKPKILRIPKNLIMTFATIGDKLGLPLNTERLQKLTENFVVSNIKITKALNKQLPLTAENGLIETLKSFS
jgi:nucleoside-diphosphate-sugar epimerase